MSRVHRLDDVAASRWLRVTVPVSGNQAHQHDERSLVRRQIPPSRRSLIRRAKCSPPWTTCTRALCGARLQLDNGSGKLGQRRASAGLLRLLIEHDVSSLQILWSLLLAGAALHSEESGN